MHSNTDDVSDSRLCVELVANYVAAWPCATAEDAVACAVTQWQRDEQRRQEKCGSLCEDDDTRNDDTATTQDTSSRRDCRDEQRAHDAQATAAAAAAWTQALHLSTMTAAASSSSSDVAADTTAEQQQSLLLQRALDTTHSVLTRLRDNARDITRHTAVTTQLQRRRAHDADNALTTTATVLATALQPLLQALTATATAAASSSSSSITSMLHTAQRGYDALLPHIVYVMLTAAAATVAAAAPAVVASGTPTASSSPCSLHAVLWSQYATATTATTRHEDADDDDGHVTCSAVHALLSPFMCAVAHAATRELHYHFHQGMPTAQPHEPQHLFAFVHDTMVRLSRTTCVHVQRCCYNNTSSNDNNDNTTRTMRAAVVRALTAMAQLQLATAAAEVLSRCYCWRDIVRCVRAATPLHMRNSDDGNSGSNSSHEPVVSAHASSSRAAAAASLVSHEQQQQQQHLARRYVVHMINVLFDLCTRMQRTRVTSASAQRASTQGSVDGGDGHCCCCCCCSGGSEACGSRVVAAAHTPLHTCRSCTCGHAPYVCDAAVAVLCEAVLDNDVDTDDGAVVCVYTTMLRRTIQRAASIATSAAVQWRRAYLAEDTTRARDDDGDAVTVRTTTTTMATRTRRPIGAADAVFVAPLTADAAVVSASQRCTWLLRSADACATRLREAHVLTRLRTRALLSRLWCDVLVVVLRDAVDAVATALSPTVRRAQQQQQLSSHAHVRRAAVQRASEDVATLRAGLHALLLVRTTADAWRSQLADVCYARYAPPVDLDDMLTTRARQQQQRQQQYNRAAAADEVAQLLSSSTSRGVAAHVADVYQTCLQCCIAAATQLVDAVCACATASCARHAASTTTITAASASAATRGHDAGNPCCCCCCRCACRHCVCGDGSGNTTCSDEGACALSCVCALQCLLEHMAHTTPSSALSRVCDGGDDAAAHAQQRDGSTPRHDNAVTHTRPSLPQQERDNHSDDDGNVGGDDGAAAATRGPSGGVRGCDVQLLQHMRAVARQRLDAATRRALASCATRSGHHRVAQLLHHTRHNVIDTH